MRGDAPAASRILVVEDDTFFRYLICETLRDLGHEAVGLSAAPEAMDAARREKFSLLLVDAMLPNSPTESGIGELEARGGFQTGVALLRRLRNELREIPAILITGYPSAEVERWCQESNVVYMLKPVERNALKETVEHLTGRKSKQRSPATFIVHGKDQVALEQLRVLITKRLGFDEPIILRNQPGKGKTLIESLESLRNIIDVAFVLLTPDDELCRTEDADTVKRCARQNVIFELGLLYGYLGRTSGRVILLHHGPIDLPSDIGGIKWVDISSGVDAAEADIRRELSGWL